MGPRLGRDDNKRDLADHARGGKYKVIV